MKTDDLSWIRKDDNRIEVFYKNPDTHIKLYEIETELLPGKSSDGFLRTLFTNRMRKKKESGAQINQKVPGGGPGSAAMIDYMLRFGEHPDGMNDENNTTGDSDAVRSRAVRVLDELFDIAQRNLTARGTFHLFEAGPGYLRTQLGLIKRLSEAQCDLEGLEMAGADVHPDVVRAASRIIGYEGIGDMVSIYEGDAGRCLKKLNRRFDAVLAEGIFEYMDMKASLELFSVFGNCLKPHGHLIATAALKIPKKKHRKYLDAQVARRSKDEFVQLFKNCGFEVPWLISTDPPIFTVGVGEKADGR
jgi:hypothetical protein